MIENIRSGPQKSALHEFVGGCIGGDFGRGLSRQVEPEFVKQQPQLRFWFGVAGQHEFAAVGCRYVNVDHLNGRSLLKHAAWCEPGRQDVQAPRERNVQAIGDEGDENVRPAPRLDGKSAGWRDRP